MSRDDDKAREWHPNKWTLSGIVALMALVGSIVAWGSALNDRTYKNANIAESKTSSNSMRIEHQSQIHKIDNDAAIKYQEQNARDMQEIQRKFDVITGHLMDLKVR